MRKIRELLFMENEFSAAVFPFGMMAIMGIVWMLMKGFIFRYFIWQNEIHSGVFLNFIYVAVGVLNAWIVDDWCKNRSIIRMAAAGVTPLGAVLTLRWLFSGFITPKLTCCANLFRCICKLRKGKNPLLLLVGRLSAKR